MTKAKKQPSGVGHNSGILGVNGGHLRSFIERLERLEEDKKAVGEDIKQVYAEAKSIGFETKIIRHLIRERKIDEQKRRERDDLIDIYKNALGMLADTPLGESAIERFDGAAP